MKTIFTLIIGAVLGLILGMVWSDSRDTALLPRLKRAEDGIFLLRLQLGSPTTEKMPPETFTVMKVVDRDTFLAFGGDNLTAWVRLQEARNHGYGEGETYVPFFLRYPASYGFKKKPD